MSLSKEFIGVTIGLIQWKLNFIQYPCHNNYGASEQVYGATARPEARICKALTEGQGWLPWRGLQRGRCVLQAAPYGAVRRVQDQRYHFSACNQHAFNMMP